MSKLRIKAIDFDKSPVENLTVVGQINKCQEEDDEFYAAVIKGDITNALEEYHDKIMSATNLLVKMGLSLDIIEISQLDHFKKLETRGIVFKE